MITKLSRSAGNVYGLSVDGPISVEQFNALLPEMEALIKEYGSIKLLIVVNSMQGYGFKEFAADIKFVIKHWNDVAKLALVSDLRWLEIGAKIDNLFTKWEERCFPLADLESAWTWVEA